MESKWFSTTIDGANAWGQKMDFGSNYRIIEITVPEAALDNMYYGGLKLDGVEPAYNSANDIVNTFADTVNTVK